MTSDINLMGELSTTGTVFFTNPVNTFARVVLMRFNNPNAYTLTLRKHNTRSSSTVVVYTLNLSAGDTITDSFTYVLNSDEYLSATSDIAGTSYLVVGSYFPIV